MSFRFYLHDAVIVRLLHHSSLNSPALATPAVDPFSTLLEAANRAVEVSVAKNSFKKLGERNQLTKRISRRRALRESQGKVYRKL